ncbi:hypothetical protein TSAR_000020 [Trichomalopsis sarcophagae]|uniref:Uncharacterized protein n=1 Tax=Trichomalopsis sarcophagae TaxID=543379 RepID=A0A232F0A9_9HYME|nr:hypothetical protein TSAR_000020 [Trichomalopsis sarcophagae]
MGVCVYVYCNIFGTTTSIFIKFDIHIYFWILNSGKQLFNFLTIFFYGHFLIFKKHYFAFFFNHPIVTNNSATMHLKENKIT